MIVPQFWAEARVRRRERGRQVTIRRFGWSDESQEDAQRHADERAEAALQRVLAGEKLDRREPKRGYNGAQGVPIREEIVSRHGDAVVTRNSYGARCLNTPNALFVDVDDEDSFNDWLGCLVWVVALAAFAVAWRYSGSVCVGALAGVGALIGSSILFVGVAGIVKRLRGDLEPRVRAKIATFLEHRPEWNLRLYRTPAGMRVLVTHKPFDVDDPAVGECFDALGVDPVYATMCRNQRCFRARVSPKPWRIGIAQHILPRRGAWPVRPEVEPLRREWVERYEAAAANYAACRFVESFGSGVVHHQVRWVQELHDEMCGATSEKELA